MWCAFLPLATVYHEYLSSRQSLTGDLRTTQHASVGTERSRMRALPTRLGTHPGLSFCLLKIFIYIKVIMASLTFKRKTEVIPFNFYQTEESTLLNFLIGRGPWLPRRIKLASWSFYLKENNSSICSTGNSNIWKELVSLLLTNSRLSSILLKYGPRMTVQPSGCSLSITELRRVHDFFWSLLCVYCAYGFYFYQLLHSSGSY